LATRVGSSSGFGSRSLFQDIRVTRGAVVAKRLITQRY
jgi:hypothetical protein